MPNNLFVGLFRHHGIVGLGGQRDFKFTFENAIAALPTPANMAP